MNSNVLDAADALSTLGGTCQMRHSVAIPTISSEPIVVEGLEKYNERYEYIIYGSFYCRSLPTIDQIECIRNFLVILSTQSLNSALSDIQGGAFSMVILDRRDRTLLLISDRYGLVPLYFSSKSNSDYSVVEFSTFLDAWADFPIDPVSISEFIHYGCLLFSSSLNVGVDRLKGGQYATISGQGELTFQTWWSRTILDNQKIPVLDDLIARTDEAFRSFFCKVPTDKGAIAGLSGGFDSRLIVSYLAECNVRPLQACTMGALGSEEVTSAQAVARMLRAAHSIRQVPVDLIATDGVRVSRSFHLNASLEAVHVDFLRSLVAEAIESAPSAIYLDGFLGDVVMGGTYFSGVQRSVLGILGDISAMEYTLTPLASIESYVEIAINAKQRNRDPFLSNIIDIDKYMKMLSRRVLEEIAPIYEIAGCHQDMINLMRLSQRGYRYIMNGPRALLPIIPVYLPFMDYVVRDALDKVPLSILARHRFYRAFLRARFPLIAKIPKASNGASAESSESVFRIRQYGSGFMRHAIFPLIYRLTAGRVDMKPEYASMQNYLNNSDNIKWIDEISRRYVVPASMKSFGQLNPVSKLRLISLWLAGYSIA